MEWTRRIGMDLEEVTEFDEGIGVAMRQLLPQLSQSAAPPTDDFARSIVESDSSKLLVARENGQILGMLTLVIFPIPSGVRAWIEDVVVDTAGRGKGIGEKLNRFAIDIAKAAGARTVDLTSRPSREAANELYKKIGFLPRKTNIYRYELG